MKKIAIIGASYLQLPLIEKAKEMGYETHVFAWAADDIGEKAADYFYPISIIEKDEILSKCKEINISGICSIASDLAMLTVNYVANKMGLTSNSMHCTEISTNKHLMRMSFEKRGDPSPKSILIENICNIDTINMQYPVIVKPTDRSGSRGIVKVENPDELSNAITKAMSESFEKKVLVEEFAVGEEYSVEYISYKGVHNFLAVTKKFTTGAPNFIETGHLQPAPLSDQLISKIKRVVEHALDSLEIKYGASHSEIKIDINGVIKIIEIGARMGGDCIGSDLVPYSTGVDFVKAVIDVACGKEPEINKNDKLKSVECRYIFNTDDLLELENIQNVSPEKVIKIPFVDKNMINCATDSSNRAGCYIMCG